MQHAFYCAIFMVLLFSCSNPKNVLPLQVLHKVDTDTLKLLTKGTPPFMVQLSHKDSTLITQKSDSVGIIKLPLPSSTNRAGNYIVTVQSYDQDTTFSFYLNEKPIATKTKERPQKKTATTKKAQKKQKSTQRRKKTKKKKSTHGEWTEWARHDCFQYIWYRYRVWKYYENTKSYRYEYQLYNDYEIRVIMTESLVEPEDISGLKNLVAMGADLTRRMHQQWLDGKSYSAKMKVDLLSKKPQLFIWRLQAYTPTHPYAECD